MKHWNRRLPVKILCFILTVPLLFSILLGIVGIGFLWSEGFYSTSRDAMVEEAYGHQFQADMYDVMEGLFENTQHISPYTTLSDYTSLRFGIYDAGGYCLYSTDHNKDTLCFPYEYHKDLEAHPLKVYFTVVHDAQGIPTVTVEEGPDVWQNKDGVGYIAYGYVERSSDIWDTYWIEAFAIDACYTLRYWIYPIVLALVALFLFCSINLLASAGRRPKSDALHPSRLDWCPTDVLALATLLLAALWLSLLPNRGNWGDNIFEYTTAILFLYAGQGLLVLVTSRIKRGQLLKNTLLYKVGSFVFRILRTILRALPLIWKTALLAAGLIFWNFLMVLLSHPRPGFSLFMFLTEAIVLSAALLYYAACLRRLQKGGQALAQGDLTHHVDTAGLPGDLKAHAENLNNIAAGMSTAVSQQLQSERMKTELITNVSHDIKNPLTSIINYAELIAQKPCENEHHSEYAQVLGRKSAHLKRLLEDLVEVSKATTGSLDVELAPCQAGVLLEQLSGEFEERCQQAGLTLVTRQPETPLTILADSRRIWRVFENLMSNACKYSLPGSRVYLSLERRNDAAVFTFRNTSRDPLDISPEELIERFVRGDSARSTEGNGLGLSIAQSLTQLQGGEMNLGIDGDLFKVTLSFPLAEA